MKLADKLNLAGIVFTGAGSTLAMIGVYNQMNGYFAFAPWQIFSELRRIFFIFVTQGWAKGMERMEIATELAEDRKENRTKSLIGFYCVLFGFILQMIGAALLTAGVFANDC